MLAKAPDDRAALCAVCPEHFKGVKGAVKQLRIPAVDGGGNVDYALRVFPARADPAPDKAVKGRCGLAVGVFLGMALVELPAPVLLA